MGEIEITGKLDNWTLVGGVIWGEIYNDKLHRWRNGYLIHTSTVVSSPVDIKEGNVISTLNSRYLLGAQENSK